MYACCIVFSVMAVRQTLNLHLCNLNHYDDQQYTALWDELPLKLYSLRNPISLQRCICIDWRDFLQLTLIAGVERQSKLDK